MTETSFPFGSGTTVQAVTDAQFAQLMSLIGRTFGVGSASDLLVTRTSGLGLQVAAGQALVAGMAYQASAPLPTVTLAAADPTNPRIDVVVLRRVLTSGATLGTTTVQVVQGTPAASPTVPTLSQVITGTYEFPLCQVTVPAAAAALVDANLTDVRNVLLGRASFGTAAPTGGAPGDVYYQQM